MQVQLSRDDAWTLLEEWTESESLRRHMLAVEAAMRAYAPRFDGDVELWGLTGLLHDLDYERYPNLEDGHPRYALRELEKRGYPPELVRAVASHADFLGVSRDSPMEKTRWSHPVDATRSCFALTDRRRTCRGEQAGGGRIGG
jgi:putative nucleotidyltransferase with HDIG domain